MHRALGINLFRNLAFKELLHFHTLIINLNDTMTLTQVLLILKCC